MEQPEQVSIHESEQSAEVLVPKNLLPPALVLLPRHQAHRANSLLPMLPLPNFVGIIPTHQPLYDQTQTSEIMQYPNYLWIGTAFNNIVFRKYNEASYQKIDNSQENWNLWACDLVKLLSQKPENRQTSADLSPFYKKKSQDDQTLIFQSRFESGNLSLASKISDSEYNLLLQNDINTSGYSQWFFFKVSNTHRNRKVRFNILNMYKQSSLFLSGMRIVAYSVHESAANNLSWHRVGENIQYYQNGFSKSTTVLKRYFTLSWEYTFQYDQDQVYFAYSYPFTYTHLDNFLQRFQSDPIQRNYIRRTSLCKTIAGNRVDVLTITEEHPDETLNKAHIVIGGRVHPGETVSSYVVNGILQFLMSTDDRARQLRQNFIFKIVPMLNPDGVIHGNYRSNLSGSDLNRKWQNPSKTYHPEIHFFKQMILDCHDESSVLFFCDFHGHSMKKNAFVYGCHDDTRPFEGKEFPFLISKLFRGFSFKDCSFLSIETRQGSARSVISEQLDIDNVYTLESSFCGPDHENIHFSVQHFEQLGKTFCQALTIFFEPVIKDQYLKAAIKNKFLFEDDHKQSIGTRARTQYFDQLYQNKTCLFERVNSQNSQGSEPEIEMENLLQEQLIKKFLQLTTRSLSQKKRQSIQEALREKIKFVIHKSVSREKPRDDSMQKKQAKPNAAQIALKKKKQEALRNKIEIFKKVEPKLFEASEFFAMDSVESRRTVLTRNGRNNAASEKNLPRKKSLQEDIVLPSKIRVNSKFEFIMSEEPLSARSPGTSIFNNNFLSLLPPTNSASLIPSSMTPDDLMQPGQSTEIRKISEFKIRRKEPQLEKPRKSLGTPQSSPIKKRDNNVFKAVLESLKKK